MRRGALLFLIWLLLVGVGWMVKGVQKTKLRGAVREEMYQRYAALSDPDTVKRQVDTYHDDFFEQCYRFGLRTVRSDFDAECHRRLMDTKLRLSLQYVDTPEILAARAAREARIAAGAPAIAAPDTGIAHGAGAPSAAGHRVEIQTMFVRAAGESERDANAFARRQYVVDLLVVDGSDEIRAEAPPTHDLTIRCDGQPEIHQTGTAEKVRPMGPSKSLVSLRGFLPNDSPGGRCQVSVSVTNRSGLRSAIQTRDLPSS